MSDDADASSEPQAASPIDRLLDLGVFAPLGFVLKRDEVVQDLAAAGRKQIAFSRSLGRAALRGLAKGAKKAPEPAEPAEAPVPGYESMTAREVTSAVPTLTASQLRWLRDQEAAGKNRVTVLRAVDSALSS